MHLFDISVCLFLIIGCHAFFIYRSGKAYLRDQIIAAIWGVPFVAMLVLFLFLDSRGWLDCAETFTSGLVCLLLGGCVTTLRPILARFQNSLDGAVAAALSVPRDLVIILISAVLSFLLIELPWNDAINSLPLDMTLLNMAIILVTYLFLYFVGQRSGAFIAAGASLFTFTGVAQYYIAMFKQSAILPSDIMAFGTAMAVSDGYDFIITDSIMSLVPAWVLMILGLSLIVPCQAKRSRVRVFSISVNWLAGFCVLASLVSSFKNVSLIDDFGCEENYWESLSLYKTQGFLPSFISLAQTIEIDEPFNYSFDDAEEVEKTYAAQYDSTKGLSESAVLAQAQFSDQKPAIVAIMNESYADLSVFNGLDGGYGGPAFPRTLTDGLAGGRVLSSVYGGGTCNSEFEFLTGLSMAHIGFGKYPYTSYDLSNVDSLPKQLGRIGYRSIAIHPNNRTNWNRDVIYRELGFDTFLDIGAFEDGEWYHSGMSDATTYSKVLDELNSSSDPVFIFDATMQNHGGYTWGNIPDDQMPSYAPQGVGDNIKTELNEYIACINSSDADLEWFLNELRSVNRPVVVVFFGDHHPGFTNDLNKLQFGESDEISVVERLYETPYFIWANYDVAGADQVSPYLDMNISSLGATTLELIGVPLNTFQKAMLSLQNSLSFVNIFGYRGPDSNWYKIDDGNSPYQSLFIDRAAIQYRNFAELV